MRHGHLPDEHRIRTYPLHGRRLRKEAQAEDRPCVQGEDDIGKELRVPQEILCPDKLRLGVSDRAYRGILSPQP